MTSQELEQLFGSFDDMTVLVIGDVMIDAYYWGRVDRISPEAPVPVVHVNKKDNRLGGAANVALNIMSLGAKPIICSVIGDDDKSTVFDKLLENRKFTDEGIIHSPRRMTTVKTRVISSGHHMLRVDEETASPLPEEDERLLCERIEQLIESKKPNVIILEDYNKGVLTENVIRFILDKAKQAGIPVTVDPKKENFFSYKGATLFKPNLKELREGTKIDFASGDEAGLLKAVQNLEERLGNEISLITLSEHGIFVKDGETHLTIPAHVREILDVSGAGDTVISVASLCLAAGCSPSNIAILSNLSGGMVCERVGVVPIDKEQLLREAQSI